MSPKADPSPFVKWAGGKSQLLGLLVGHIPPRFKVYHEPFLGGGALFFRLYSMGLVKKARLADASKDLINSYIAVRDETEALLSELEVLLPHAGDKDFFYEVGRPKFNKIRLKTGMEGNVERAALFIYLNKTCYNGLYRVNSGGEFNVPWGRYRSPKIYDEANLREVAEVLRKPGIGIRCCDYADSISEVKPGDFAYLDPPYQPLSKTAWFAHYTPDSFRKADQERLASVFRGLDARGCLILMSNSFNPLVEALYGDYMLPGRWRKAKATRKISCNREGRGRIDEYIIWNYDLPSDGKGDKAPGGT
jgi:DNA adenine methylase